MDFQVKNKAIAFIGRQKLKIDRGRGWAALFQFGMQGVTLLAVIGYADWIKAHIVFSSFMGMALVVGGLWIIGEIEHRAGLVNAEYGRISSLSPVYQDIFAKFDHITQQNETLRADIFRLQAAMAQYCALPNSPDHRVESFLSHTSFNNSSLPDPERLPDDSAGERINSNAQ